MPLVEIRNLEKIYEHEGRSLPVLRGIDLDIEHGDVMAIVGPSGAGKSTLLHCIGTLDLPTKGTIKLDGRDATSLSSSKLAELRNITIGFVFQFHHLLPEFTAIENVFMPGLIGGKRRRDLEERATSLLTEVGLGHRLRHRPGEQQLRLEHQRAGERDALLFASR